MSNCLAANSICWPVQNSGRGGQPPRNLGMGHLQPMKQQAHMPQASKPSMEQVEPLPCCRHSSTLVCLIVRQYR